MTMRTGVITVVLLALAACSLQRPYPGQAFYAFDTAPVADAGAADTHVRIPRARVAPPFRSRAFQYRIGPDRYEPNYYERWSDDPGALVAAAARAALAGVVTVVDEASPVPDAETLELYVTRLAVDTTGTSAAAVLEMRVTRLDADGTVRSTREHARREPMSSDDGAEAVRAWNAALRSVFAETAAELVGS